MKKLFTTLGLLCCLTGPASAALKYAIINTGTSFTVPSDFSSLSAIDAIGAGSSNDAFRAGGGGGGFATQPTASLSVGNSLSLQVGIANGTNGLLSTVTISNASPAVITWTQTFAANQPVFFTNSGGGLPTGITALQLYYVISTGLSGSSFEISATVGGAAINTSSAGSGTQSGHSIGTADSFVAQSNVVLVYAPGAIPPTGHTSGGVGGQAANAIPTTGAYSGGTGGIGGTSSGNTGGSAGAAGPNGAGVNGVAFTGSRNGGAGDAGFGGAGGTTGSHNGVGGMEWTASTIAGCGNCLAGGTSAGSGGGTFGATVSSSGGAYGGGSNANGTPAGGVIVFIYNAGAAATTPFIFIPAVIP